MYIKQALRECIAAQCDIESVSEDTIAIIGPLDLNELADTLSYLARKGELFL